MQTEKNARNAHKIKYTKWTRFFSCTDSIEVIVNSKAQIAQAARLSTWVLGTELQVIKCNVFSSNRLAFEVICLACIDSWKPLLCRWIRCWRLLVMHKLWWTITAVDSASSSSFCLIAVNVCKEVSMWCSVTWRGLVVYTAHYRQSYSCAVKCMAARKASFIIIITTIIIIIIY